MSIAEVVSAIAAIAKFNRGRRNTGSKKIFPRLVPLDRGKSSMVSEHHRPFLLKIL